MEYRFKRDLKNSFMIAKATFDDMGYEKDILMYNDIDILVPFHTVSINNEMQVWYDITGLVSLKDYLMQQGITLDLIRKVLVYLKIAIDETERYLIDVNHLIIDANTIFVVKNNSEWKLMLIYYPDNEDGSSLDKLTEFLMENADDKLMDTCIRLYDESLNGVGIDGLISIIDEDRDCEEVAVSVEEDDEEEEERLFEPVDDGGDIFEEEEEPTLIDKIKDIILSRIKGENDDSKSLLEFKKNVPKVERFKKSKRNKNRRNELSEDFIYEPDQQIYEPTVLLTSLDDNENNMSSRPRKMIVELQYMGDNKKDNIKITKDVFLLGSSKEGNDGVIDSPVVSRYHARIRREGRGIYIEDLNSTNGTSVNGELLGYQQKVEIKSGDEIMFADECYKIVS